MAKSSLRPAPAPRPARTAKGRPVGFGEFNPTADLPAGVVQTPRPKVIAPIAQEHPRYKEWLPAWQWLGYAYEGDGPYMTGDALVPHTRELLYRKKEDGQWDFDNPVGEKRKFTQRKTIARYENFASTIVDLLVDHQYAKGITRTVAKQPAALDTSPLQEWWQDVDGFGTKIDDWLNFHQRLAHLYGHLFVLMDRARNLPGAARGTFISNITPARQKTLSSLAELGRPVLRAFIPPDVPDWLASNNQLSAVKFKEPVERADLLSPIPEPVQSNYLIFDREKWTRYNGAGVVLESSPHGMGRLPVVLFYAKRRARIPIIGRSVLRDPKKFQDHYNLISELREIFRAQTFSMLHIGLGEDEQVKEARDRLGEHAGTDALVFTRGGAEFIAPPDGPAERLSKELDNLERKMFREAGLQWEDPVGAGVPAADTVRLQATDTNRTLAAHADEAEKADYDLARLFFCSQYGARGPQAFEQAEITISHPDEFYTEQISQVVADALSCVQLRLGATATTAIKMKVVKVSLPDLGLEELGTIEEELDAQAEQDEEQRQAMQDGQTELQGAQVEALRAGGFNRRPRLNPQKPPDEQRQAQE